MTIANVRELLKERIGLNADSLGTSAIDKPVADRMRQLHLKDPLEYARRLRDDEAEFHALVDGVVVVESWFFRGGDLFTWLADFMAKWKGAVPFRALSIPCCTGEEIYSLKMALIDEGVSETAYSLHGVDISGKVVEMAKAGLYGEFSFRQAPDDLKRRYFRPNGPQWEIAEDARRGVQFRQGNIVDSHFLQDEKPFDLILCRNLMIYLAPDARNRALQNLDRLLSADGLLGMGHAEPIQDARFEKIEPGSLFLYRRRKPTPAGNRPALASIPKASVPPAPLPAPKSPARDRTPAVRPLPTNPQAATLVEVHRLADRGDISAAMDMCRALEKSDSADPAVHHMMGLLHLAGNNASEALNSFRKAVYLKPDHRDSLIHLMHLCRESGDVRQADLYLQRWERLNAGGEP